MVKKTAILMIFMLMSISLFADEDHHGKSLENVLGEIREELKVDTNSQIDPALVSEGLLEELGDAVMSLMHPDERQHEWMDRMMGGEGSESLKNAHIRMAYNYLSGTGPSGRFYGRGLFGRGFAMPMMGYNYLSDEIPSKGYSGRGLFGRGFAMPMMGFPYHDGWELQRLFYNQGGIIVFIVLIALVLIVLFIMIGNRKKEKELNPFDILKKRLASGEIDINEYEELKKKIL